jgi:hypothetical protein
VANENYGLALRVDDTPGGVGVSRKRKVGFWTTLTL